MLYSQANQQPIDQAAAEAGVVHDLGNLIQIASSAMNLLTRRPGCLAPEVEPVIAKAQASLMQAGALVRQSIGRARPAPRDPVSLDTCLAEIASLVRLTWDRRFQLIVRMGDGLPQVLCDPSALQSAVLNLLLNARDAMPDGGVVAVSAVATPGAPQVEIRVADKGVGMTEDTIRRAFEPFFTTKPEGLGGLGLPMAQRFALDVGGEVLIASEPGVGTVVTLRLPAAPYDVTRLTVSSPKP